MRDQLKSIHGPEPGGLSGRPITAMVTSFIAHIHKITRGHIPLIGVGGIFNAEDKTIGILRYHSPATGDVRV
jgi:dihydroorotate dehydrogenase